MTDQSLSESSVRLEVRARPNSSTAKGENRRPRIFRSPSSAACLPPGLLHNLQQCDALTRASPVWAVMTVVFSHNPTLQDPSSQCCFFVVPTGYGDEGADEYVSG